MSYDRKAVGQRIYAIRLALGDGQRMPMPMRAFAALLNHERRKLYNSTNLSLLERGAQRASLEDVDIIAPHDPLHRGHCWLAFGDDAHKGEF